MREAGQGWLQGSPVAQNQHRCTVVPKARAPRRTQTSVVEGPVCSPGLLRVSAVRCPGMRRDPAARSNAPTQGLARI